MKRFNLSISEEQLDCLLMAIEVFIDNESQTDDSDENKIIILEKIKSRLIRGYRRNLYK